MEYMDRLQALLADYRADIDRLERSRKPTDGLLGFGKKPGDDACHDKMDERVRALAGEMTADPDADGIAPALRLLLNAGTDETWPDHARWMLLAQQRHFLPLIPRLSAGERAELAALYDSLYPRRLRLPVQKQLAKALKR